MCIKANSPFENYGKIAYIVKVFSKVSPQFGKTALQKIFYILQESLEVPFNYRFDFFTHGPFSSKLANDLELAELFHAVRISKEEMGTSIGEGEKSEEYIKLVDDFASKYKNEIYRVLNDFGEYNAKELEIRATLILIYIFYQKEFDGSTKKGMKNTFIGSKPFVKRSKVNDALDELIEKNYIRI